MLFIYCLKKNNSDDFSTDSIHTFLSPPCGHKMNCSKVFCSVEFKFVSLFLGVSRGLWGERTTWTRWRASMFHTQSPMHLKTSSFHLYTHTQTHTCMHIKPEGEGFTPTQTPGGLAVLEVKLWGSCFIFSFCLK